MLSLINRSLCCWLPGRAAGWLSFCLVCAASGLTPVAADAAITQVNISARGSTAAGSPLTMNLAFHPTIGNTLIVYVWSWSTGAAVNPISIADNFSNTYSTIQQTSTTIPGQYQDAAILSTTVTSTNPVTTFTVTVNSARIGGPTQIEAVVVEYSGIAGVDVFALNTGAAATATVTLPTQNSLNELVAAVVSIINPAANFTAINPTAALAVAPFTALAITTDGQQPNNAGTAAGELNHLTALTTTTTPKTINWTASTNPFTGWAAVTVSYMPDINCTSVAPGGNWSVPATWTSCNGSVPPTGGTATIANGAPVTIDAATNTLTKLTINNSATLSSTAGALNLGGAVGAAAIINNGTLNLGSTSSIVLGNNLSMAGGGSWTLNNITAGSNSINATGITSSVTVTGNMTGTGSFTPGASPWSFTGTAAQTIPGTGTVTFSNLTINNTSGTANGVTMTGNVTVGTALTLTNGVIKTGANTLTYSPNCSATPVTRTNGYVFGNLSLNFPAAANVTCIYPVGDTTGYAPITQTFTNSSGGTLIGTTQPDTSNTQVTAAGLLPAASASRYWTLTKGTLTFTGTYSTTLQFNNPADIGASSNPLAFIVKYFTAAAWATPTVGTRTVTSTQATGMNQANFGLFVVGNTAAQASPAYNFNVVDSNYAQSSYNAATTHDIYTKLAGWDETAGAAGNTTFKLDVIALNNGGLTLTNYVLVGTKNVRLDLFDDSSGTACNSSAAACSACAKPIVTAAAGITVPFVTGDAGYKNDVTVAIANTNAYPRLIARITDTNSGTVYGCSTDAFAVRPRSFTVTAKTSGNVAMAGSASGPAGAPVVKAGANFTLTATSGVATYTGTPTINIANVSDFLGSPTPIATLFLGSFNPAVAGTASGTFTYGEVGYVNLGADAVIDSTYADSAAGDIAGNDCVAGSTSNTKASGLYGCNVGSAATSWGRFIPDHFGLSAGSIVTRSAAACAPASTFTYMGEPMQLVFTLTAQNAGNGTTLNYAGAYAMLDPTSLLLWPDSQLGVSPSMALGAIDTAAPTLLSSRMSVTAVAATGWAVAGSKGSNTITATANLPRGVAPDGPYGSVKLGVDPRDGDGVKFAAYDLDANNDASNERRQVGAATSFRFGRLRLSNAFGSEKSPLAMPVQAHYWSGSSWVLNGNDSCTSVPASGFFLSGGIAANTSAAALSLSGGTGTLTLAAPAPAGTTGSVYVAANLGIAGNDQSCLGSHGGTPAGQSWLRSQNGSCAATYDRDPSARASFGIYSPETQKNVHVREQF